MVSTPKAAPVATDQELCNAYNNAPGHSFGPAHLRAVYDLGRQHGAAPLAPPAPLADLAATLIAESKPMDLEMALTPEERWGLYESPAAPPAPETQPAPPAPEVWDGPSLADVDELCAEFGFHYDDTQGESLEILQQMVAAAITRWRAPAAQPATPPAPEVGEQHVSQPYKLPEPGEVAEVGELADRLGWIAAQLGDIGWSDDAASVACAATLLSQLSAPAPAAEPVAPQTGDSSTITPQP
jgi:hypothetical protein